MQARIVKYWPAGGRHHKTGTGRAKRGRAGQNETGHRGREAAVPGYVGALQGVRGGEAYLTVTLVTVVPWRRR